jgi:hypothetical protein
MDPFQNGNYVEEGYVFSVGYANSILNRTAYVVALEINCNLTGAQKRNINFLENVTKRLSYFIPVSYEC